jgi:hypothetical protein
MPLFKQICCGETVPLTYGESSESAGKCQNIMYLPTARGEKILFDEKVTSTIMKEYS